MRKWIMAVAVAAAGVGVALQPAAADDKDNSDDVKFVHKAASGGMMEVKAGELAKDRAYDGEVKRFGQRMVTDHTKVNKELMTLAGQMGIKVPERLMTEHQQHLQMLSDKRGEEFDRVYVRMMVEDHKKDVEEFQKCSQTAKDARLRAFCVKTLPALREHLTMIEAIAAKTKK